MCDAEVPKSQDAGESWALVPHPMGTAVLEPESSMEWEGTGLAVVPVLEGSFEQEMVGAASTEVVPFVGAAYELEMPMDLDPVDDPAGSHGPSGATAGAVPGESDHSM